MIQEVCAAEQAPAIAADLLDDRIVATSELMRILFRGLTEGEYHDLTGRPMLGKSTPVRSFCRRFPMHTSPRPGGGDPDGPFPARPTSCSARVKPSSRAPFWSTTRVRRECYHYGGSNFPTEDRPFTIEGGDVIILNEEAVLVGASERTKSATIEVLAQKVFDVGHVKRFYEIPSPRSDCSCTSTPCSPSWITDGGVVSRRHGEPQTYTAL